MTLADQLETLAFVADPLSGACPHPDFFGSIPTSLVDSVASAALVGDRRLPIALVELARRMREGQELEQHHREGLDATVNAARVRCTAQSVALCRFALTSTISVLLAEQEHRVGFAAS